MTRTRNLVFAASTHPPLFVYRSKSLVARRFSLFSITGSINLISGCCKLHEHLLGDTVQFQLVASPATFTQFQGAFPGPTRRLEIEI